MIPLKTIVVATDLSPLSECAVRYGCELASRFQSQLHLLTVVTYPFYEFAHELQDDNGRLIDINEREHREAAEKAISEVDIAPISNGENVIRTVCDGFPLQEILSYSHESNTDLLILGTHGRTGLKHVLMGSVAESVVSKASCPVLTVRDPQHKFAALD